MARLKRSSSDARVSHDVKTGKRETAALKNAPLPFTPNADLHKERRPPDSPSGHGGVRAHDDARPCGRWLHVAL
eukprot:347166-Chlamydomonas_euryale.AAC.4